MAPEPTPKLDSSIPLIEKILIVGAGWTGRQIAGQIASHGLSATLIDNNEAALQHSLAWIDEQRHNFFEQGYWPKFSHEEFEHRVHVVKKIDDISEPFDLVLESVSEQFSLKRRIIQSYSKRFDASTIIASNSSYFTPSMMQPHCASPERFANLHFHVPIWRATLVDIVPGPLTDESTLQRLSQLSTRIGQTPLVQHVENPGYVFNWMLKSLMQSALQLVDRGVAEPGDIDMAWKKVTGMAIGPFGMMDQIGLDLVHQTMSHARFVDGDAIWQPLIDILQPYVDRGDLGVKIGRGFFEYKNE